MAEEKKQTPEKQEKKQEKKAEKVEKKPDRSLENVDVLIRILGYDIPGNKNIYSGLTRIKGISWSISNAICIRLNLQRTKKISELTKVELKEIEDYLKNLDVYPFMKNRRSDPATGETKHLFGSDLDVTKDFDIKRLKKIRSWRGIRHAAGQPVRGQRTRSHFRARDRTSGIKLKRKVVAAAPAKGGKK